MQAVTARSQQVVSLAELDDEAKRREIDEIEQSMAPFHQQIAKWEKRQDDVSQKMTEFLRAWLALKEKEKAIIESSLNLSKR